VARSTRSPRVHWFSNHPAMPTGYGTQSAQVVRRLKRRGHPTSFHSNFGHLFGVNKWNGMPVYPQGYDGWSQDVIMSHYRDVQVKDNSPLVLVTLCDVWVLANPRLADIERIWSWVPIDHNGVPPKVEAWLRRPNVTPIAMSQHGARALDAKGIEHVYIPHALEKHWKPTVAEHDPWEGKFVVTIPNANKGVMPVRKAWGENLLAFSAFAKDKDDVLLYLHTDVTGSGHGIDLPALIKAAGIHPDKVMFVDQYEHRMGVSDETMAAIYTRSDVLLSASAGEGFGLPVLEAQACGTPVIVSNFSAQPELVGDGWVVQVQPQWNPTQLEWFCTPMVHSIVEALEAAYERGSGRVSQEAVTFAAQYDADKVFDERWVPLLDSVQ
jgi:glycosyltransferase involved in cell wall biosynthesis